MQEHEGFEKPKHEHTDEIKEQEDENDIRVKQMLKVCQVKTEKKEKQPQGTFTISLAKFKNKSRKMSGRIEKSRAKSPPGSTMWRIGYENEKVTKCGKYELKCVCFPN
ncbi:hypothetical protein HELRODRAFT_160776 [Helobdella robusta]|uniref:Uncharacterized protein n=1 Tax=Helobdella robusta TaxID=6412 RepID=T1EQP9_HELRO|nr:hypothetical protein HELRODRAFT_160776 [Helobdella robusta]ESO06589.1 hypothetical protein HELRODRAFT_160776 [Helobdella robusta]